MLGIAHVDGVPDAPTATIAWLGDTNKPCVALRADIDALPILERTGFPTPARTPAGCTPADMTATRPRSWAWRRLSILAGGTAGLREIDLAAGRGGRRGRRPAGQGRRARWEDRAEVRRIFGLHGWPGLKSGPSAPSPAAPGGDRHLFGHVHWPRMPRRLPPFRASTPSSRPPRRC